jgi:phosphopantetheinyl transferase
MDHHSRGVVLFPAVEIMDVLARAAQEANPSIDVTILRDVRFDRFIALDEGCSSFEALCPVDPLPDRGARAALFTRAKLKGGMSRLREHAVMVFGAGGQAQPHPPLDELCCLQGVVFTVDPEDVYRDLVPFGPSYRNLSGPLHLTEEGALGRVSGGDVNLPWVLGSPFALDAAFHAACAWSQRFAGVVAFPLGFTRREIYEPALAGEVLICRIVPAGSPGGTLIFNIHLVRDDGRPCESLWGLVMGDVSRGQDRPPHWIHRGIASHPLRTIAARSSAMAIVERKTLAPFAALALSPLESQRHQDMGPRRSEGFIAARLCCKKMSRELSGGDRATAARSITTMQDDLVRPRCPSTDGSKDYPCSVSHDDRFAFAASAPGALGVDVERLADRVLRGRRFYMNEAETLLTESSPLGALAASLRIWSIKECVTKALGLKLYEAWRRSEVTEIGEHSSAVTIDGRGFRAFHDSVDDHLFTLLVLDDHNEEPVS